MLRPRNDHALSKTRLNPMHRTCYVMRAANAGTRSNPSWSCCPGRTFWTSPCQQHETIMSHFESKNKNTRNSSRLNYDDTRLLELQDLPSNVLIWEGPTVQMLSRNAVQRSELLGRKKQSLCCLCHQKLISPCRQSFKNMGVRGIGGKFVWLIPVRKPLPCITGGGSCSQNSEHHFISLLEPTWKILSTIFYASASSAEGWLNGKNCRMLRFPLLCDGLPAALEQLWTSTQSRENFSARPRAGVPVEDRWRTRNSLRDLTYLTYLTFLFGSIAFSSASVCALRLEVCEKSETMPLPLTCDSYPPMLSNFRDLKRQESQSNRSLNYSVMRASCSSLESASELCACPAIQYGLRKTSMGKHLLRMHFPMLHHLSNQSSRLFVSPNTLGQSSSLVSHDWALCIQALHWLSFS